MSGKEKSTGGSRVLMIGGLIAIAMVTAAVIFQAPEAKVDSGESLEEKFGAKPKAKFEKFGRVPDVPAEKVPTPAQMAATMPEPTKRSAQKPRQLIPGELVDVTLFDGDFMQYAIPESAEKIRKELNNTQDPARRKQLVNLHLMIAGSLEDPGKALEADRALDELMTSLEN